ncbi:hypothetical protein sS8_3823 [Methylocaldum marinum]|uniref:Uncharacterized protein n=1 Tax=Methylocaldum marinum TaxID=1432792 RepID=A0A250KVT4_9GAMM|nr:hypothetical protein sS8_3823 [Methylocaldum marinum]
MQGLECTRVREECSLFSEASGWVRVSQVSIRSTPDGSACYATKPRDRVTAFRTP